MKNKKNIPNILTISRLISVVIFILLLIIYAIINTNPTADLTILRGIMAIQYLLLVVFIFAMVSDYLDGYLARKWNVVSTFGKIFDPIADKLITTTMLISLIAQITEIYFIIIVILLVLRDILVDGFRIYAASLNISVQANIWGKIKTILMSVSLIIIGLFAPIILSNELNNIRLYLFIITLPLIATLIISYISGYIYISSYLKNSKFKIK
ncbi:CDP-diacylglycerol--glycerol-3-phosphate 3-phosphatidyltransferase [Mycoplasma miroungirhinis]|uniref:CDP-diacylglycerol--glycerol-3-phosphate 3-phosphatidyltransferase n=1 Tax=Mycoplasma miroungirhinis TaxID=754516 RepID=A0A6M4JDE6_9MOLU|nr:CDP-diacylglycerol--glycerol-3-phosphate 3-phosphatidyltransferase [Mycoplasma miroungirhinis]QJR44089.1 CDP-diacylglycerol--glycerol-3-phosphate 3-phosphatidyltransferase [Mycoplasma miroungirhinis]